MRQGTTLLAAVFATSMMAGCNLTTPPEARKRWDPAVPVDSTECIVGAKQTTCGHAAADQGPSDIPAKTPAAAYDVTCMSDRIESQYANARDYTWVKNAKGRVIGVDIVTEGGFTVNKGEDITCMFNPVSDPSAPKFLRQPKVPLDQNRDPVHIDDVPDPSPAREKSRPSRGINYPQNWKVPT